MPRVRLADLVSLRSGVLLLALGLWGDCGDNTVVGKAEQSWHRRGLRAGLCLWTQVGPGTCRLARAFPPAGWGCTGVPTWPGMAWVPVGALCLYTWVQMARGCQPGACGRWRVLSDAPACVGAGRAAWMRLEAWQLIVGLLGVLAAPALPRAWHWALPMHRDPWRP